MSDAPARSWWTALAGLVLCLVLLRWLAFAAIRFLVRERIRLRYVGPRGIRGLHFRQHGFGQSAADEGIAVKLQSVTIRFNKSGLSWFTVHVSGVTVAVAAAKSQRPPKPPPGPAAPSHAPPGHAHASPLRNAALRLLRPFLFLVASALPTLTRLVNVELSRIEVHLQRRQAVVRIATVRVGVRVEMIDKSYQPPVRMPVSRRTSLEDTSCPPPPVSAPPAVREGHARAGLISYLGMGLPEARLSTTLEWSGVQAFDAAFDGSSKQADDPRWSVTGKTGTWEQTWDRWAQLETRASFLPASDTAWSHGEARIPAASRLLFSPEPSTLTLHTMLGPHFFHLKAHRAFSIKCELGEQVVGLDALQQITSCAQPAARANPSKREPLRAVVAAISSVQLRLAQIRFLSSSSVSASMAGLDVSLFSVRPDEPDCRQWLHTQSPPLPVAPRYKSLRMSLHDRLMRPRSPVPRAATPSGTGQHERRRVFRLTTSLDSIELSHEESTIAQMLRINTTVTTTWTPIGYCLSIRGGLEKWPPLQPVQMATLLTASIGNVELDLDLLKALPSKGQKSGGSGESTPLRLPELHARIDVGAVRLRSAAKQLQVSVPHVTLISHGAYRESPCQRTDAQRRAAWKAFDKNILEWRRNTAASMTWPDLSSTGEPREGPLVSHKYDISASVEMPMLSARASQQEILRIDKTTLACEATFSAFEDSRDEAPLLRQAGRATRASLRVHGIDASLTEESTWQLFASSARPSQASDGSLLSRLPQDICIDVSVTDVTLRAAATDTRRDAQVAAGVAVSWRLLALDYAHRTSAPVVQFQSNRWAARAAIELGEDAAFSADALAVKHTRAAALKVNVADFVIASIDPPAARLSATRYPKPFPSPQHRILTIPSLPARAAVYCDPDETLDVSVDATAPITFAIELANSYLLLLVAGRASQLRQYSRSHKPGPLLKLSARLVRIDCPIHLPEGMELYLGLKQVYIEQQQRNAVEASIETILGAVRRDSVAQLGELQNRWEEVLTVRDLRVATADTISARCDSIALNVPFLFTVHSIVEATSVAVKATKQLIHELLLGQRDYELHPSKMGALCLPPIDVHLRTLVVEAEDDPMETRLGLLWTAGCAEAQARRERDAVFAKRMAALAETEQEQLVIAEDARRRLDQFNSAAWVRRVANARRAQERREERISKRMFGKFPRGHKPPDWPIPVRARPAVAPLFRSAMSNIKLAIREATFGASNTRDFINAHGDPIPAGTEFSVLVPVHIDWKMSEWRINMRDYPLPLFHVPFADDAWETAFDFCVAEQLGDEKSTRHIDACIVHAACEEHCDGAYIIKVPKVVMPTKVFGRPVVRINAPSPVRITWGQSLQPPIADMVRVFEGFSSPPHDPSPKLGFWDKIPLIAHGTLSFIWPNPDGAFHFYLKGSRDPYQIEGYGAGWALCWQDHVELKIGYPNPEREVMQMTSRQYILAIPDLSGLEAHSPDDIADSDARPRVAASFQKPVWRLLGNTQWGLGMLQERACDEHTCLRKPKCSGTPFYRQCRFFDRTSHWSVITKTKAYVESLPRDLQKDTYAGWRHDHLHCSIAVRSTSSDEPASNSLHLTPLVSTHFWAWLALFNHALSLPIRQGSLFPDMGPRSPKFGMHTATLKYRIDLDNFFLSHVYLQQSAERYSQAAASYLGLKAKVGQFRLDVHQRQQETIITRKELGETRKSLHKPINAAEIDLEKFELRVLGAQVRDSSGAVDVSTDFDASVSPVDQFISKADADPHNHDSWWDANDFVELGLNIGREDAESSLRVRSTSVLECPRFNYRRKLRSQEQGEEDSEAERRIAFGQTKFGDEPSHTCYIGCSEGPSAVQKSLINKRIRQLAEQMVHPDAPNKMLSRDIELLKEYGATVASFDSPQGEEWPGTPADDFSVPWFKDSHLRSETKALRHEIDQFTNVFLFHNPAMFLSDTSRDALLKYYMSNRARRGFVHHMTAKAVRSIRSLALGTDAKSDAYTSASSDTESESDPESEDNRGLNLLRSLLKDTMQYVSLERGSGKAGRGTATLSSRIDEDPASGIRSDFEIDKSTSVMFIKPQIVLRSELDEGSSVIFTAMRTRVSNHLVRDPSVIMDDDVNEKVLNRNFVFFDKVEAWHPSRVAQFKASTVPLEALLHDDDKHGDFSRILPGTNTVIQYDKFNKLRIHDAAHNCAGQGADFPPSQEHLLHHMDLIRVQCPRFSVHANSDQYAALYNIVTDLLLYRDPAYREHLKRLETMLFAYNFRDAQGMADLVAAMQIRIRHAEDLHLQYERSYHELTEDGKADAIIAYSELLSLQQELALFMEAVSVSQDRAVGADKDKKSALRLEASAEDIQWLMTTPDSDLPLAELQIKGTSFTWLNKADNSTANTLSIIDLEAVNNRPDALFREIISKHTRAQDHFMVKQGRFVNAVWSVVAPVGGISIIDRFELNMHPVRVQIEISVGREIMNYIFGTRREREKQRKQIEAAKNGEDKPQGKPVDKRQTLLRSTLQRAHDSSDALPLTSRPSSVHSSEASRGRDALGRDSPSSAVASRAPSPNGHMRKVSPWRPSHDIATEDAHAIAVRHATEMRKRASTHKTFVYVKVPQTVFCLSYKGEKSKSLTDIYDLVFRTPAFEYRNRTWAYEDLANSFKRDVLRAAWGQKTAFLKGFLTTRPRKISAKLALRDRMRRQAVKTRSTLTMQRNDDGEEEEDAFGAFSDGDDPDDEDDEADQPSSPVSARTASTKDSSPVHARRSLDSRMFSPPSSPEDLSRRRSDGGERDSTSPPRRKSQSRSRVRSMLGV